MTAVLRLPLAEFAAFAAFAEEADQVTGGNSPLPQAFRPGPTAVDLAEDENMQRRLAARGLLLGAGDRAVLCPQLVGVLRTFAAARTRAEVRVHQRDRTGESTQWCTNAAVAGRYAARLTRAQVRTDAGLRDADVVEVTAFASSRLAALLSQAVPAGSVAAGGVRSLWLAVRTRAGTAVDCWWDDGGGWHRVRPAADGSVTAARVGPAALRRDLVDLVAGADR